MYIKQITIRDYRNYDHLTLPFNNKINVIIGENAQGKTNLMESIYVLAMAKSHRTTKDKELIRWDQPFAKVEGQINNKNGPLQMEVIFSTKGKKVKINHLEKKRLSEYIGSCNIVMFAPEDLSLVKGSPQIRRRFLDMEMGQIHPVYLYYLSQYHKQLKQRNQWLKDVLQKKQKPDATMLDVMTDQLIISAGHVIEKRYDFIKKLQKWAAPIHHDISRGLESLEINYVPSINVSEDMDLSTLLTVLKEEFDRLKDNELRRGITLIGPHRDDLQFLVNGRDIQTFGSQGQQRTTALSVKLAELELIHEKVGEYPILLLDDVLSELDDHRQSHLLNTIQGKVQTFVTTTSVDGIEHATLRNADMFYVQEGKIEVKK
ncbi:DNA replication/repair protein RecF [Evansella cellulosilytica]|uniref:DNA replication and repair protein RecF n=1 Tax=Evansella cellulosilytica (strain ATCC 21833 / DSM 2522 / FERM P-1141 / JCM 9156 / N-4) TaxID=649639 RepID=E6TRK2_EVAC2|nr:DNA replication/repair protein RecF [Evansella cellulosilytica]ADU28296.1 DNA replication and repair protein RecF [Evansella cellulosilytica DSM 2522]